jgi:DedD protein
MADQEQDVDALKRRGRRRLVGAVALVLGAVIVLPMVFDPAPRSPVPAVSVRIPGEDETPFKPKPPAPRAKPEAPKPEAKLPEKPAEKATVASAAERARAEAAIKGEQYYVPVGAFANPDAVIAQLAGAKLPYFTEQLPVAKGKVTRVRAGPFASKAAAEKAADRLKGLGLKPGNVAVKPG